MYQTSDGCYPGLHIISTPKFKTVSIVLVMHSDLSPDRATKNALIPLVLRRGTRTYPDTINLMRRLDSLYGAVLGADVAKRGERHLLVFSIEFADSAFLPSGQDLLSSTTDLLKEVVLSPAQSEAGYLRDDHVHQEKANLRLQLESIVNDKQRYAVKRCIEEMCRDEDFRVSKYGSVEDLDAIGPESLTSWYRHAVSAYPLDVFIVGNVDQAKARSVRDALCLDRPAPQKVRSQSATEKWPSEPRFVEESMDVSQGKLVLGYRTNIGYKDPDYPALLFLNGVFGGYPHSKLFQNVREKASLAYYVFSQIEETKGIMLASAGIDPAKQDKTVEIIGSQMQDIACGRISQDEMEATRKAIMSYLSTVPDSAGAHVDFVLTGVVNARDRSWQSLREDISKVSRDDVVQAAAKVCLDTVYFLKGRGGEQGHE